MSSRPVAARAGFAHGGDNKHNRPRQASQGDTTMSASERALVAQATGVTAPSALSVPRHPARAERIQQSHLRCAAHGVQRSGRPDPDPLMRGDLRVARERNRRLYAHAAPVMEMLFEQIVDSESMIVLTDAHGTILHSVGDDGFLRRADKVALSPGVNWAEQSKGTNAIGTALIEETPTLIHAGEHFMHANGFLTCSAAPIFDPRGNMLGVLDVSGDQTTYHQHTMGLVRMSARMIENHWLSDDCSHKLRLHFHSRAEFIGTLLEGILVVGPDGRIVGANRSALDQLAISSAALRMHSITSLLGTSVAAVFDHFRAPLPAPLLLRLPDGRPFHVSARLQASTHPMVAGFGAASSVVEDARPLAHGASAAAPQAADPSHKLSGLHYLKTGDPQIEAVVHKVQRVLDRDIPLLILGETGTGKELLARAVHQDSVRAKQPFVAVNCASIPESLIEAELFGYEDGAFTGARRKGACGRIVQANGGTLFLDEIGDMPHALQARLLRVLQERCVTPLGSQKSIAVNIAVIAATHRNLRAMIDAGGFREDLYYRLNGLVVRLPALRERSDLAVVAQRILLAQCAHNTPQISASVMALFQRCDWPGNIRQLANVLRTAAVMAAGEALITEAHLSDDFLDDARRLAAAAPPVAPRADAPSAANDRSVEAERAPQAAATEPHDANDPAPDPAARFTLGEAELEMIRRALAEANGNISVASRRLGISRNTSYRKLRWGKAA
jgi:transcriptional regulator of acetoin/glycerol metabolism